MSETPASRLKQARISQGFPSAMSAAKYFGWKTSTYSSHENGSAAIKPFWAELYSTAFRVNARWILSGNDETPSNHGKRIPSLARSPTTNIKPVPRPLVNNSIFVGSLPDEANQVGMVELENGQARLLITAVIPAKIAASIIQMVNSALFPID